jgi:hypothetical protein
MLFYADNVPLGVRVRFWIDRGYALFCLFSWALLIFDWSFSSLFESLPLGKAPYYLAFAFSLSGIICAPYVIFLRIKYRGLFNKHFLVISSLIYLLMLPLSLFVVFISLMIICDVRFA